MKDLLSLFADETTGSWVQSANFYPCDHREQCKKHTEIQARSPAIKVFLGTCSSRSYWDKTLVSTVFSLTLCQKNCKTGFCLRYLELFPWILLYTELVIDCGWESSRNTLLWRKLNSLRSNAWCRVSGLPPHPQAAGMLSAEGKWQYPHVTDGTMCRSEKCKTWPAF